MDVKLIIIGFLSGIISAMGIGGGTLLIPFLVIITELGQIQAQGLNLIVFIPVASLALIVHRKEGNLETKYTKKIVPIGIIGAILGSLLALRIDQNKLRMSFGIFLIFIGLYEFFKKE